MNPIYIDAIASAGVLLLLWVVLGKGLLKPFFDLVDERERRTTGDQHSAIEKRAAAKALVAQIEEQLRKTRLDAIAARDARTQRAREEAQTITDRASQQAAEELKRAEQAISDLKAKAMSELAEEAEKLSKLVVSRVLESGPAELVH